MASCQCTDANKTATSFPDTPPMGDGACGFVENKTTLMPIAAISPDPLRNDLGGIGLCPIDDGFPASTDAKRPGGADCEVSADIRYSADSRAWAFGVGSNVVGLNANSSVLALLPRISPVVGEGKLACTDWHFLSDPTASGRSSSAVLDRQEQRAR
jgi:hypothetical protein